MKSFFISKLGNSDNSGSVHPLPVHAINIKIVLTSRRDRGSKGKAQEWGKICVNWEIYFADLRAPLNQRPRRSSNCA